MKDLTARCSRVAAFRAVMDIGTSCRLSLRRVAVTTTSSTWPLAGVAVCATAVVAPNRLATASTQRIEPMLPSPADQAVVISKAGLSAALTMSPPRARIKPTYARPRRLRASGLRCGQQPCAGTRYVDQRSLAVAGHFLRSEVPEIARHRPSTEVTDHPAEHLREFQI